MPGMRPSEAPPEHRDPSPPPEVRRRIERLSILRDARGRLNDTIRGSNGIQQEPGVLRPTDMAYAFEQSHQNPPPTLEQRKAFARLNLRFSPPSNQDMPDRYFPELKEENFRRNL